MNSPSSVNCPFLFVFDCTTADTESQEDSEPEEMQGTGTGDVFKVLYIVNSSLQ